MAATATHRVTIPKKTSNFLANRAKETDVSFSAALNALVEEHIEMMEDLRLSAILAEREAQSDGKYIPLEEVMRKYDAL